MNAIILPDNIEYLCTDSRSVSEPSATVFAAIRTDVNDGHRYIPELYQRGVRHFIVDRMEDEYSHYDASFYQVDSVENAIMRLAASRFPAGARRILITGSHGKTSMKELLYRSLLPMEEVVRSPRSWNSSLGFCLSVFEMGSCPEPRVAIAEVGIDGPGQAEAISPLTRLFDDIGIISSISEEHDDAFASHRDKILEKLNLLKYCRAVIYDASDSELCEQIRDFPFSHKDVRLVPVASGNRLTGIAAKALEALGHDADALHPETLTPVSTRRDIRNSSNENIIIRDNFTNDLRSLRDALDFMRRQSTPTKDSILIVGDLLHRHDSGRSYGEALRLSRLYGIGKVIAVGKDWAEYLEKSGNRGSIQCFRSADDFTDKLGVDSFGNTQILVFGSNADGFDKITSSLQSASHDTTLDIDLDALVHNYNYYRHLLPSGTGMVAMVKASAYGLGAVEIGKTLQAQGAAALAVAVIDEGIALRQAGITMPVIVLNPVTDRYPSLFDHNLEPAVFSFVELDRLIEEARKYGTANYPVHIKFDTGMHRVGFLEDDIEGIARGLKEKGGASIRVASVFSHLATADCLDLDEYTQGQIDTFYRMSGRMHAALGYDVKRHILNTAGMMRFADCGPYEMARLGIGLYGISPLPPEIRTDLQTVAAFRSHIISLKHWPAGTPIGYGCKGRTGRDSVIATVPVGYADGVNRRLGNGKASFIVRGVACPTIGNICMDLCMVDVTDAVGAAVGDKVEIFGPQMPIQTIAETLGTIPYEILTSVSPRVRRAYFRK